MIEELLKELGYQLTAFQHQDSVDYLGNPQKDWCVCVFWGKTELKNEFDGDNLEEALKKAVEFKRINNL